ncbi:MAG: RNA-protein complex protein Nop10 [archaeon]
MSHNIHKCPTCYRYTLKEKCPVCAAETIIPAPARFSPDDKYVKYRLEWRLKNGDTDKDNG